MGFDEMLALGQMRRKLGQKSGPWTTDNNRQLLANMGANKVCERLGLGLGLGLGLILANMGANKVCERNRNPGPALTPMLTLEGCCDRTLTLTLEWDGDDGSVCGIF